MQETAVMLPEPASPPPAVIGQALLFSDEIEGLIDRQERSEGLYTAERFKERRPEAYQAVVQLLGADVGMLRIAKLLGIHHLTVAAVRDREPESVDIARSKTVARMRTAIGLQIERLIAHPELVPWNAVSFLIAQLTDKAELLDGRATARTETRETLDIFAHWEEVKERLLSADEVREVPAEIGLDGGNKLAIGAPAGEPDPAQATAAPVEAASDAQSPVLPTASEGAQQPDTTSDTEPNRSPDAQDATSAPPDARNRGGRGSAPVSGGGPSRSGYNDQNFMANRPLQPPPI